jgi:hypothetical protein
MSCVGLCRTAEVVLEGGETLVRVRDAAECDESHAAPAKTEHTTLTPAPKRLEVRRHAPTG